MQAHILGSLQRSGAMIPLAFHGGTALRFLFSHGRFSEDLDFALEGRRELYDFRAYLTYIRSDFESQGYVVDLKVSDQKTVHSAVIRFPGLLFELGLSPLHNETLSVKLEVDTKPPAGAGLDVTVIRRFIVLQLQHHDKASLLAGKLHALLHRPYTKGRDMYDLLWYLSDASWPKPNFTMLNNALTQTGWSGDEVTAANWKKIVQAAMIKANWRNLVDDVRPFIEPGFDVNLLTLENMTVVLNNF